MSPEPEEEIETITVTVSVTDEDSNPMENVSVVFAQNTTTVDDGVTSIDGECTINVVEGVYDVSVTRDNYIQHNEPFIVSSENNTLTVVLSPIFTGEVPTDNSLFQANVYMENQGNVYGAEIIIYGQNSTEPIDKIIITDATDFKRLSEVIDNLKEACVPYTSEDRTTLDVICDYLADKDDPVKEMKYLAVKDNWSSLHNKGDLETILQNNINLSEDTVKSYEDSNMTVINATHIIGITAGDFSLVGHQHSEYLASSHSGVDGKNDVKGHVRVIDNLNSTDSVGSALSANQGKKLNERITSLEKQNNMGWSKPFTLGANKYITLRVNEALHLVVCDYNRPDSAKLSKDTGIHDLHNEGTLGKYAPTQRVMTPVYRGDIVLMFNKDGSVKVHNLVKKDSWNIRAQVMWYYQ